MCKEVDPQPSSDQLPKTPPVHLPPPAPPAKVPENALVPPKRKSTAEQSPRTPKVIDDENAELSELQISDTGSEEQPAKQAEPAPAAEPEKKAEPEPEPEKPAEPEPEPEKPVAEPAKEASSKKEESTEEESSSTTSSSDSSSYESESD